MAFGAGLGVAIGAELGNVLLWILIGAVAGLALASPRKTRVRPPGLRRQNVVRGRHSAIREPAVGVKRAPTNWPVVSTRPRS